MTHIKTPGARRLTPAALLLALSGHGPDPHHLWTHFGPEPGDRCGTALAGVGDVDGDGRPDVVVGLPRATGAAAGTGLARVLSGADGTLLLEVPGTAPAGRFGASVGGVGDVDGDGTPDFVVGAPYGAPGAGSAGVYSGSGGALLAGWTGGATGDRFGQAVCGLGDLDGDGRGDVAVGAPLADVNGTNSGRVEVFSGADGSVLLVLDGAAAWDQFGFALAGPGDVDGDGVPELLVGAPFSDANGFNAGSAYLHSGADGHLLLVFHGAAPGDWLGSDVDGAGDANGDGTVDLALGVPGSDLGGPDSGGAEVRSGIDGSVLLRIAAGVGEYAGSVSRLGDADGDGFDDLLFGSPASDQAGRDAGWVRVVSGRTGCNLLLRGGLERNDWLGAALARVGDVNGDGRPDFACGAPVNDDVTGNPGYVQLISSALPPANGENQLIPGPIPMCE